MKTTMLMPSITFEDWMLDLGYEVSTQLDCTSGDAYALIDTCPFIISQSWGIGRSVEETALLIINS